MDFIDNLKQFSLRVEKLRKQSTTEEATKMSLILPFFSMLGYDVFNPSEFMPEYTADIGIKKGEKIDYAILKDGKPTILIECKACAETLDKHSSQLFRYFATSKARFGILTNGIIYKFYTDLEESNKMDLTPFLEFDILNIKENIVKEIKKFHKDSFDIDNIFTTASELKYSKQIKELMTEQLKAPSDDFVRYILANIYDGVKTQNVIDKFKETIKISLNDFVNELLNDKITSALKTNEQLENNKETEQNNDNSEPDERQKTRKINTSIEELEAFFIIKTLLSEKVQKDKIFYKDTESYLGILYENNIRKWICRLKLETNKKYIIFPADDKSEIKFELKNVDEIYNYKDIILDTVNKYL